MGEFNGWNRDAHACQKDSFGVWKCRIPDNLDGTPAVPHGSQVMIAMVDAKGDTVDRVPAWTRFAVQDEASPRYPAFQAVHWSPERPYVWKYDRPQAPSSLRIYEAHVGMSSEECKVS